MTLEQELDIRYNKGVEDGIEQGAEAAKRELAKGLRDKGFSIEVIAELTKLSKEAIIAL